MTCRSYFLVGCFALRLIPGGVIARGTLSLLAWAPERWHTDVIMRLLFHLTAHQTTRNTLI